MLYNKHNLAVAKFAAKESGREEIKSVLFKKDKSVATDSYRLLEVSVDSSVKVEDYPHTKGMPAMRGCEPFLASVRQVGEIKIKKSEIS